MAKGWHGDSAGHARAAKKRGRKSTIYSSIRKIKFTKKIRTKNVLEAQKRLKLLKKHFPRKKSRR